MNVFDGWSTSKRTVVVTTLVMVRLPRQRILGQNHQKKMINCCLFNLFFSPSDSLSLFLSLFVAFGGQSYDPIHCNDLIDVANSIDDIAPLFSRQMSMSVASLVDLPQVSSCPSGGLNHFDAMASLTMSNDARSATALLVEIKVSKWGERNANHWPVETIDAVPTI